MLKIFKYLNPKEWLMAGVSLIFIVTQVFLELQMPDYIVSFRAKKRIRLQKFAR
jgi:hypothetical protein